MNRLYSIWCEWDIGQENFVFKSEDSAYEWLKNNHSLQEVFEEDEYENVQQLINDGMISLIVEVVI